MPSPDRDGVLRRHAGGGHRAAPRCSGAGRRGVSAFKVRLYRDLWRPRAVAFVVVIATAALGASLPALAIWTLTLATLVGVAIAEMRQARRKDPLYAIVPPLQE